MGYVIQTLRLFPLTWQNRDQNKQGGKIVDGRSSRKNTITAVQGSRRLTVSESCLCHHIKLSIRKLNVANKKGYEKSR